MRKRIVGAPEVACVVIGVTIGTIKFWMDKTAERIPEDDPEIVEGEVVDEEDLLELERWFDA